MLIFGQVAVLVSTINPENMSFQLPLSSEIQQFENLRGEKKIDFFHLCIKLGEPPLKGKVIPSPTCVCFFKKKTHEIENHVLKCS